MISICTAIYLEKNASQNVLVSPKFNILHHNFIKKNIKKCLGQISKRICSESRIDIKIPNINSPAYITGICDVNGICLIYHTETLSHNYLFLLAEQILANNLKKTIQKNFKYLDLMNKQINLSDINLLDTNITMINDPKQIYHPNEKVTDVLQIFEPLIYLSIIFDERNNNGCNCNCNIL